MGHIHVAPAGANGPIVALLVDFAPLDATSGETRNGLLAEGTIAAADVAADPDAGFDGSIGALVRAMRSEGSYVNVHTVANPSGEIRGQITTLPNGVEDRFSDDDGSVHEGNIDIIAAADITLGCDEADPSLFCPSEAVTRGQMASFIQRALNLPAGEDPGFTDIAGNEHEDEIGAIAAAGITIGCGWPFPTRARATARSSLHVAGGARPRGSSSARRYQKPATSANAETPNVRPSYRFAATSASRKSTSCSLRTQASFRSSRA